MQDEGGAVEMCSSRQCLLSAFEVQNSLIPTITETLCIVTTVGGLQRTYLKDEDPRPVLNLII